MTYECILRKTIMTTSPARTPSKGLSSIRKIVAVAPMKSAATTTQCAASTARAEIAADEWRWMSKNGTTKKSGSGRMKAASSLESRSKIDTQMAEGPARKPLSTTLRTNK